VRKIVDWDWEWIINMEGTNQHGRTQERRSLSSTIICINYFSALLPNQSFCQPLLYCKMLGPSETDMWTKYLKEEPVCLSRCIWIISREYILCIIYMNSYIGFFCFVSVLLSSSVTKCTHMLCNSISFHIPSCWDCQSTITSLLHCHSKHQSR
jgi:hypothetical protein